VAQRRVILLVLALTFTLPLHGSAQSVFEAISIKTTHRDPDPRALGRQQAPVQQPSATQSPALPDVRFEVASIKRNRKGEAERAALLTLRPAEGPVEILVIESIDHPTEN
jgi:hypothetical protein